MDFAGLFFALGKSKSCRLNPRLGPYLRFSGKATISWYTTEIRGKRLGCRGLRQLRRNREIRQIPESQGEVTARREPRPTGRAKLLLSPIQPPVAVSLGQPTLAQEVDGFTASAFRYQFKFLTVRNLINLTPRRSYDCVSVNSLQCGYRRQPSQGHGGHRPPPLPRSLCAPHPRQPPNLTHQNIP